MASTNPSTHFVMLLDSLHQVLSEDVPALQEARGCELRGTTTSLCKKKTR